MKYLIEQEQIQALVTYLSEKPWKEANNLVVMIAQLQPIPEKVEKPTSDEPKKPTLVPSAEGETT